MNTSSHSRIRILFYSLWVISLLIQAYFTELNADEAYYWLYSKKLEWGYFDHPPVIAALIKAGYFLFPNELGIRFISIIMGVCTILLWERIVRPKDLRIFYCLVASVGILHFTGFFAIPDSPLIFFLSVYLLLYREFTINPTFIKSLLLGIAGALMILSKYHGIVIVGLTVLSNLKLLLNRYFWLAAAVSAACLVPHFLWQVQAGFPSIKYHLSERNSTPYSFSFTLEYLIGQLFVL
ncbi:MAG TPA: glycosyltransferase family 39 protein, partial [Flavobacteriales bacterium]|nr:glycosyltransferase family 39 protein [Flavobacteriales bacterium]